MDPSFTIYRNLYTSRDGGGSSSSEDEDLNQLDIKSIEYKELNRLDIKFSIKPHLPKLEVVWREEECFRLYEKEYFIDQKLVSKIQDCLLGIPQLNVNDIPLTYHIEKNYEKAKLLAKSQIPNQIDLIFLCGKQFDSKSSLQMLPIELIQNILRSKYAAFLDFEAFKRGAEGKVYDTLASRMFREVPLLAVTYAHIQSEIDPCVIS